MCNLQADGPGGDSPQGGPGARSVCTQASGDDGAEISDWPGCDRSCGCSHLYPHSAWLALDVGLPAGVSTNSVSWCLFVGCFNICSILVYMQ